MLEKEMIADATQWRMVIRMSEEALYVLALPIHDATTFIYRKLPMDMSLPAGLKTFENVIYDNPLLLSDFGRIDCLYDTSKFIITPFDDESTIEECHKLLRNIFPADDHSLTVSSHILPHLHFEIDNEILGFLRRTFFNVRVSHPLSPLISYFTGIYDNRWSTETNVLPQYADIEKKMLVNFRDRKMDVIVTDKDNLLVANSFTYEQPEDAVYYILAVRDYLSLNQENDPILYFGSSNLTDIIMDNIRKFVRNVDLLHERNRVFDKQEEFCEVPFELISLIRLR